MKAAILCVGTELLLGDTLNTNATYLAKVLAHLQIHTMRMEVVGDNPDRLRETFTRLAAEHDLVVVTGGLGPTVDDITKECICESLGLSLEPDKVSLANLYERSGHNITQNNFKQIMFPEGAVILENKRGSAPGMFYDMGNYKFALLPGPPRELVPMTEKQFIPVLKQFVNSKLVSEYLNVYGISESKLETRIADILEHQTSVKIGTYFDGDKITLRLSSSDPNRRRAQIAKVRNKIIEKLPKCVTTQGEMTIEELLVAELKERKAIVATAESCTAGMVAAAITSAAGSSLVFREGFVNYSYESKMNTLGVDPMILKKYSAISAECTAEMAKGLLKRTKADIVCTVTGQAGLVTDRDLGTEEKSNPVGTVYIGIATRKQCEVIKFKFSGNRGRIRSQAARMAIVELVRRIQKDWVDNRPKEEEKVEQREEGKAERTVDGEETKLPDKN